LSTNSSPLKILTICICNDDERKLVERELSKNDFDQLVISTGEMSSLEFLADCIPAGPRRLLIQGGVASLKGLDKLGNLVDFKCDIVSDPPYPSVRSLRNLEKCWIAWDKKYDAKADSLGLFSLDSLASLTLRSWSKADCSNIGKLVQLRSLDLRQGSLTSLDGLQLCKKLTSLSLGYLDKLGAIDEVRVLNLEAIRIEKCPILDLTPVAALTDIRDIHIENVKGHFDDLDWIADNRRIEKLRLSCEIMSIDWAILFNHPTLRDVGIQSHDGYSLSDAKILEIARNAKRKVINFKRIGRKGRPSFSFDLD
jgi:hypothetical protein